VRKLKADKLLAENIRTLLYRRGRYAKDLAQYCGHKPAWLTKILSGERGVQVSDLGMIADFFGLTVAQLFLEGISDVTERRRRQRRSGEDRRQPHDRRLGAIPGDIHPDADPHFPERPRSESRRRVS
jgi:transcriptional regulator with XRE-family HTH domain